MSFKSELADQHAFVANVEGMFVLFPQLEHKLTTELADLPTVDSVVAPIRGRPADHPAVGALALRRGKETEFSRTFGVPIVEGGRPLTVTEVQDIIRQHAEEREV